MLASRTTTTHAHNAFLQLPSRLRVLTQQQSSRSFSATACRKDTSSPLVDIVVGPPLGVLNALHAVGIPWYAAIPTAAILIRGVFGYYFSSVPARRRLQIRNNANPLIAAMTGLELQNIAARLRAKGQTPNPFQKNISTFVMMHKMGKRFGAGLIAFRPWVNFVAWIATSEAIRMKCGARDGLLPTLLTPVNWVLSTISPERFPAAPDNAEIRAQALVERLEHLRAARLQQAQEQGLSPAAADATVSAESLASENLHQIGQLPDSPLINVNAPHFEPTFQTEGFSWCSDLTAVDPYYILPCLTGGVLILNVLLNPLPTPRVMSAKTQKLPAPLRFVVSRYTTLQTFGVALFALMGNAMTHMPAAIPLYILSSAVTGFVQRKWLDLAMPLGVPIKPCRRSTRVRSRKEWNARQ